MDARRRGLIALGCAMATLPIALRVQPASRVPRVGFLALRRPSDSPADQFAGFAEGLRALGYVEGRDIVVERRYADGRSERLPGLAAELVALRVDVVVAGGTQAVSAIRAATTSIPIVMAGANDPVGSGFVASLSHPGGNVTGSALVLEDVTPKQLEILRNIVPTLSRVAVVLNPANASAATMAAQADAYARRHGMAIVALFARTVEDIDEMFVAMGRERIDGVVVASDALFTQQIGQIVALSTRRRLPLIAAFRQYADAGALASYGPSIREDFIRAASYVHRILQGAKPQDLPVEQAKRFELVINLGTARTLGIEVPPEVLLRADDVIR